jgi:hypothetical protein
VRALHRHVAFELPPAMIGRCPMRLQIRTGLIGPSSKTSIVAS